jgi:hypothetical protein
MADPEHFTSVPAPEPIFSLSLLERPLDTSIDKMELWLEGAIDLEGFETQLLYGLSLCLLAVATEKGRTRLLRRLRDLER